MAKKKLAAVVFLISIAVVMVFLPGVSRYHQLKTREVKLCDGIEKLRIAEVELIKKQNKLQKDFTYIEKTARDKLQVAEKGETIVRVEDKNGR